MPASVGELLEEAQRLAWDLSVSMPQPALVRVRRAAAELRAQVRAWPGLAATASHALSSLPLSPGDQVSSALAVMAVDRVAGLTVPQRAADTDPDARMTRISVLLGAVGDLMTGEPSASEVPEVRDAMAVRDKVGSVIRTVAASTLGFAEVAPKLVGHVQTWELALRAVDYELRRTAVTSPVDRAGRFDDLTAIAAGDPSFRGVLGRWQVVARGQLTVDAAAASSRGLAMIAADLGAISDVAAVTMRAGAAVGVLHPVAARDAATVLDDASRTWKVAADALSRVRSGGAAPPAQLETSKQLRDTFRAIFNDPAGLGTPSDVAQRAGDMRLLVGMGARLAPSLDVAVSALARSEILQVPARVGLRSANPAPTGWLGPARRGEWVPAPANLPEIHAVVTAVVEAHQVALRAHALTAATARSTTSGTGAAGWAAGAGRTPQPYRVFNPHPDNRESGRDPGR